MVVRVMLAEVAVEVVEALLVRHALVARHAQSPFADQGRGIAGGPEYFRGRHVLVAQHLGAGILRSRVAADAGVTGVQPRHQHAAGRAQTVEPA